MSEEDIRVEAAEAKEMVDVGKAVMLDVVQANNWEQMPRVVAGSVRIHPQ